MKSLKEYQNYIFDLYGTLVDIHTDEVSIDFWEKICELYNKYSVSYTPVEMKYSYQRLLRLEEEQLFYEYPEPDVQKVFQNLASRKGKQIPLDQSLEIAKKFRMFSREYIRLYDGAAELLKKLKQKGKSIYLLSNAQAVFTKPELEILGIRTCFDGIFLSSEHQCKKPDVHFYQKLLDTYQLKPAETIMIGNDPVADIQGGRNAGLDTLYFHSNLSPELTGVVESTFQVLEGRLCALMEMV